MALTEIKTSGIADDAVTTAKLAAGTDGQIITYDASGNPTAVGPGTDGQVLTSTGAGSPPAFETISIPAGTTINTNGDNRVLTGTGTANTIQGESQLLFDSNGLLYIKAPDGGNRYFFGETGDSQSAQLSLYNSSDTQKVRIAAGDGASEAATYFNGGKVGIGTTAPLKALTTKAGSNTHAFYIAADDNDNNGWGFQADSSSGHLRLDRSIGNDFNYRRICFHGDGGIAFQGDTAAANALDDYEEGTWTPVWLFSPNNASGVSYATQTGKYVKVGRQVLIALELTLSNKGTVSGAGYAQISGLPFNVEIGTSISIGYFDNFGSFMPAISHASTAEQIYIAQLNSGGYSQDLQHSHMNNSSRIYVGGTYYATA